MAACEIAAVENSDEILECATLQLPTLILDNTGYLKSYFIFLYNQFNCDLNLFSHGEQFPEMI